jgi:hypothetical protein
MYIHIYISLYYYICVSVTGMLADASIDANIEDAAQFHDSETDSFHMCVSLSRARTLSLPLHASMHPSGSLALSLTRASKKSFSLLLWKHAYSSRAKLPLVYEALSY